MKPVSAGFATMRSASCVRRHVPSISAHSHSTLVIPEQGRADDLVLLIKEDAAVHLSAEADPLHFAGMIFPLAITLRIELIVA